MFEYNDYLRINDEIVLNKIASEIEIKMMINEKNMKHYTKEECFKETCELYHLVNKLEDLRMQAIFHCTKEVVDKCEVYIFDIEHQMNILRSKYM